MRKCTIIMTVGDCSKTADHTGYFSSVSKLILDSHHTLSLSYLTERTTISSLEVFSNNATK